MLLYLFLSPIAFAAPVYGTVKLREKVENSYNDGEEKDENSCRHGDSDDDDLSFTSLGSSTGSEFSEYTCDGISQVELCHLLGPEVPEDRSKSTISLGEFKKPKNLEHSIKIDLPVGFRRLRRAFLSEETEFWDRKVLSGTLKYKK